MLLFNKGERPDVQMFGRHGVDPVSTDIFDPRTDRIAPGPSLPHSVTLTAPLDDGRVFIAGHWSLARMLTSLAPTAAPAEGPNADYVDDWWIGLFDPRTGDALTSPDTLGGGSPLIADVQATHASAAVLGDDRVILVSGRDIEVFH